MQQFDDKIDRVLAMPPYCQPPDEKQAGLLEILREELEYACQRHAGYKNYIQHWPEDYRSACQVADLPFLPVGILKANPPLSFVSLNEVKRTLTSSATTSQSPSRVVLDAPTARRMTKGIVTIVRDFIGPARRPYLVVDTPDFMGGGNALGARGAAIQGLHPFASETTYCLNLNDQGDLTLDRDGLREFARNQQNAEVLVYGLRSFYGNTWCSLSWRRVSVSTCPKLGSCIAVAGSVCRIRPSKKHCLTSSWLASLGVPRNASSISMAW